MQASTAHRTCRTFNHFFSLTIFLVYFLMFLFTSPVNTFLLQSPPKNQPASFFFLSTLRSFAISFCRFSISDSIAGVVMVSHGISATVVWALSALHGQKVPSAPLQLTVKFGHWLHNCETQRFFTALSVQFTSFSLCCLSEVSQFLFMFTWVVLASVLLALTPGRAQAAALLLPEPEH